MKLSIGNRNKYEGKTVKVSRDHEVGGIYNAENNYGINSAVYIQINDHGSYGYTAVHPDEARTIAAALIEAADEFDAAVEAAKPNGEDFVNALPIGSRFRWSGQPTSQYWIKVAQDDVRLYGSTLGLSDFGRPATDFGHRNDFYVVED